MNIYGSSEDTDGVQTCSSVGGSSDGVQTCGGLEDTDGVQTCSGTGGSSTVRSGRVLSSESTGVHTGISLVTSLVSCALSSLSEPY